MPDVLFNVENEVSETIYLSDLKLVKMVIKNTFLLIIRIAFNIVIEKIIKLGMDVGIWAAAEVSYDGHNLDKLPVFTID